MSVCCYCNYGVRATHLAENGICKACKQCSDINPKSVLIAAALIVCIGVNVVVYIKGRPPCELTAEQREKIAGASAWRPARR